MGLALRDSDASQSETEHGGPYVSVSFVILIFIRTERQKMNKQRKIETQLLKATQCELVPAGPLGSFALGQTRFQSARPVLHLLLFQRRLGYITDA